MSAAANIQREREARGWSRPELAERMNTSGQQVERLEKGQRKLTTDWLQRAADAFGIEVTELLMPSRAERAAEPPSGAVADNAVPFRFEGSSGERPREDLPVYGTALGAPRIVEGEAIEQTMLNTGEVQHYVTRPPILNGRTDVYALYTQGSSMAPVHPEGSMTIAESRRPPMVGDDVAVYLRPENPEEDDGMRARGVLLKRLVRRTAAYIELEQFNPPITFRIPVAQIVQVHRIMTMRDILER